MKRMVMYACILTGILLGCSPAKRAAQQKRDIDALCRQCIDDYVKANPCPQLPEINLDSLCEGLGYDHPYDYLPPEVKRDTVTGVLKDTSKQKPCKPQRILVPGPPDKRLLQLVTDSLNEYKRQLAHCQGKATGIKEVNLERKQSQWKWNNWAWVLVGAAALFLLLFLLLFKKKR